MLALISAPALSEETGFYVGAGAGIFSVDIDVSGVDLSLVGSVPVGETFFAFGRLGMIAWDADLDAVIREDDGEGGVITTPVSSSESGEDLMYGAGFWRFN